ncbi:hypothetical protein AB1K91_05110 [Terribacillus sp. 179-K 1B1 HS]|uniref:hypothetical protein n=1 Tax=Terribacillus sp. 179-K 1B1 HS TaxID=3142388 RepID=UPI0039A36E7B
MNDTRTKLFQGYFKEAGKFVEVDEEINAFLEETPFIEVVDIKYSRCSHLEDLHTSALLIYRFAKIGKPFGAQTKNHP